MLAPPTFQDLQQVVGPAPAPLSTWLSTSLITSTIFTGIAAGEDRREIAKRLQPLFNGSASSARRLARTEGLRVATATSQARAQATTAALSSTAAADVANRADAKLQWTSINDLAETLGYVLGKLAISRATFVADITSARNGKLFEQTPTDPGVMFDNLTRQAQSKIVQTLGTAISVGVGDPIGG